MFKKVVALFILSVFGVVGCASQGGYQPAVDTYNDPNAQNITRDMQDCKQIAKNSSGTGRETAKGVLVGGLLGAAAGAAVGAAVGSPGKGAAIGAAAGGIGGGAKLGISAEERYKKVYKNCMRNRGHNVLE